MKAISLFLTVFLVQIQFSWAQTGVLKAITQIPGNFAFDIGISTINNHEKLKILPMQSRSLNAYFIFDLGIEAAGFSLNPGLGISSENYQLDKQVLLASNTPKTIDFQTNQSLKKSKFNATYFDIPLELRWASDVGRKAFRLTVGAKTGFLINSHTKTVSENNLKTKIKKDYHFSPVRSIIYGRIGYNWYGIFASYGFTDFFHTDTAQDGVPMMFGISLVGYR